MKSLMVAFLLMVGACLVLLPYTQAKAGLISLGEYQEEGTAFKAFYNPQLMQNITGLPLCPMQIGDAIMEANCPKYTVGMLVRVDPESTNGAVVLYFMIDCSNGMYQGATVYFDSQGLVNNGPFSPPMYAAKGTLAGNAKLVGCRFIHKRAH